MDQPDTNPEPAELIDEIKEGAENETEAKDLNVAQRILGVFVSPGETFAQVDRKPDWLAPLILITLVSAVSVLLILPTILPERMAQQEEMMQERGMTRAQIDQAMKVGTFFGKTMGLVSAVIGPCIGLLLFALLLLFVGNVLLSGHAPFVKLFSVCTYTSLIGILEAFIKTPLILLKGSAEIQLNCSVFLPADQTPTLLYHVLQGLDVFAIWRFAVLAIGFAAVYRFSLKKAGWTMAVLFLLRLGIAVGLKQAFGR